MVYYNPMQQQQPNTILQQLFHSQGNNVPNGGFQGMQKQTPNISEEQFFSVTSTLDKQSLSKLVNQARAKGMSDNDIQSGLDIILKHRA